MSDGPFRSLPMNRKWKKAAEFAGNSAASLDDVSLMVASAIEQEWRSEVPRSLIAKIEEIQSMPNLFNEGQLDSIRAMIRGKPMANSLLDYLNQAGFSDSPIHEILIKAVTNALIERSSRAIRQIQEHCIRETDDTKHSEKVALRLSQSMQELGFEVLAHKFLDPDAKSAVWRNSQKTGLDDGVKI